MLTDKQTYYLQTMGIEPWVMRNTHSQVLMTVVVDASILDDKQSKLLYAMFRSIGLSEEMIDVVYDLNTDNLKKHIQKIKPRIIIALGCTAGQNLLHTQSTFDSMRRQRHTYDGTPLVVTYHPSDLLQNPIDKKEAYRDLALVNVVFYDDKK